MAEPQVSPELAGKVLAAEKRNAIKGVGDGGTLPTPLRKEMQMAALTPELAAQQRAASLLALFCAGKDLSAAQWEEIRAAHPGFAEIPPPPSAAADPSTPDPASTADPLHLTPEPAPSTGDTEVTRAQLERWASLYGVEHRQLRRWIARGREKRDPCPLDDPAAMPRWVDQHLEKIRAPMREKVAAAAEAARAAAPPPVPPAEDGSAPPPVPPPAPSTSTVPSLDLANVGGVEGESVSLFRILFAAVKVQLEEAYRAGHEERIRSLHLRLEKTGEALRKHEFAAEQRARRMGEFLEKAAVLNDVTQLLTTLKLMHEQMARRVLGDLPNLDPETQSAVSAAILRERAREVTLLRSLSTLRAPGDVLLELAA